MKIRVRGSESGQDAVRRFRKLLKYANIKREMRRRESYEKPSDTKRRRSERRAQIARLQRAGLVPKVEPQQFAALGPFGDFGPPAVHREAMLVSLSARSIALVMLPAGLRYSTRSQAFFR